MDKIAVTIVALSAIIGVVFCISEDDIIGKVGFGRSIDVNTVKFFGIASAGSSSACCEECAKKFPQTQLYTFTDMISFCICQTPREGGNVKTELAVNGTYCGICEPQPTPEPEALPLAIPRKKCEELDESEIACCPQFTTGDNASKGKETFVQEYELVDDDCQKTCQDEEKFPNSVGMTQSLTQTYSNGNTKKCWCESGDPVLNNANKNYQTCLF